MDREIDDLLIYVAKFIEDLANSESKLMDFAKLCETDQTNLSRYKNYGLNTLEGGKHDPHLRTFYKILRGILQRRPINLEEIQPVIVIMGEVPAVPQGLRREDYFAVPLVEGRIAANPAGLIPGEEVESLIFLHRDQAAGRRNLVAVRLGPDADSMLPTLHPGDLIIIDRHDREITPRGLYAVRLPDLESCAVKRLQPVSGAGVPACEPYPLVLLLSDNLQYPPLPVPCHEDLIIGRIIWSQTNWLR